MASEQRPPRVLVVAEYYPRAEDPVLGVWAHQQAVAARDAGAEIRVLVLHRPIPSRAALKARSPRQLAAALQQPRRARLDGIDVRYLHYFSPPRPNWYASWSAWAAPPLRIALRRIHAAWPFDLVHAHYAAPAGDAVRRAMPEIPLVVSVHGGDVYSLAQSGAPGRKVVRSGLQHARLVLANSQGTQERSRELGAHDVRVVRLGTDLPVITGRQRAAGTATAAAAPASPIAAAAAEAEGTLPLTRRKAADPARRDEPPARGIAAAPGDDAAAERALAERLAASAPDASRDTNGATTGDAATPPIPPAQPAAGSRPASSARSRLERARKGRRGRNSFKRPTVPERPPGPRPLAPSAGGAGQRIATVAHMVARKRHQDVVRALWVLKPTHPNLRWTVVGDGPERANVHALAVRLGVADRIDFLGRKDHAEAVRLGRQAQVFVLPSVDEAFGVAYVEAMAGGIPAIGCRGEAGPEEIAAASVGGTGIRLVPPGDPEALAAEIRLLLDDRSFRAACGAAARRTVEASFTWEACGRATLAAYRDALTLAAKGS